jgi:hypothetical protein
VGYRLLADVVMVVHFAFVVFVVTGGLLAWRWPRLLWAHGATVVYAAAIVTVGFTCPLTPLEQHFRRLAGASGYEGGFVDRYIEGVIYPGQYTRLAQVLAATVIAVGYAGLLFSHSVARPHRPDGRPPSWPGPRSRPRP